MNDRVYNSPGLAFEERQKKRNPNPNKNMRGKIPREKKQLRDSGFEVELPDEELDMIVAILRRKGYKFGTLRGTAGCRVSLWSLEEQTQFTFMRSSVHVTDLETRRRYKVEYKDGFDVNDEGIIIDLNRGVEIQL